MRGGLIGAVLGCLDFSGLHGLERKNPAFAFLRGRGFCVFGIVDEGRLLFFAGLAATYSSAS